MALTGTIDLAGLAQAHRALGLVPDERLLWAAAPPSPASPLRIVGTPADEAFLHAYNAPAWGGGPIACQFVREVTLMGSGYLFHGTDVVTDGSELSDVAAQWVAQPMPDSPNAVPPATERWIEGLTIVGIAPGHLIYGHWLLDFIPRFMIARDALGLEFHAARIPLPHDTPRWALTMLQEFTGADPKQFEFYQRGKERLALRTACIPSYAHQHYGFHPYTESVFAALGTRPMPGGPRKLCVSRVGFERSTDGMHKIFQNREEFEAMAQRHGYRVVRPETMPLRDQAALFASATHVIGEFGSGLHGTVFGPAGQRVGFIRCPSAIQFRIGAMRRQPSTVVMPADDRVAPSGILEYTLSPAEMKDFFEANEA